MPFRAYVPPNYNNMYNCTLWCHQDVKYQRFFFYLYNVTSIMYEGTLHIVYIFIPISITFVIFINSFNFINLSRTNFLYFLTEYLHK